MTFERYIAHLTKQWKLIVICFIAVGLGTFVVSKLMTPLYQSVVLVQVTIHTGNNQSDYTNLLASDQLVQTEAQLATSDPVLRAVASHFQGLTIDALSKAVTSTPRLNTQLFEINVLDADPQRASKIANDIANTLIQRQQQAILDENSQAQQQFQQELTLTQQQIDADNSKLNILQAKGGSQTQIAAVTNEIADLQKQYDQWQTSLAQLELSQAQSGNFLRIVQSAQPGLSPVRPNILLNTSIGLVAGLLLGVLWALLYGQMDKRVRTPDALTELLGWPVLATIFGARGAKNDDVVNPTGHNANVESYRILRTNIGFSGVDKPLRFLMVTSAVPRDGKSTIAANLAIFLAKAGKNTLIVDADMRRPTIYEKFGMSNEKMGLSNAILACAQTSTSNSTPYSQFMGPQSSGRGAVTPPPATSLLTLDPYMHSVGIPNLRVMPSGPLPPNPSELLDSKAMQRLFMALENCGAEIVIFDTPPILGLSDASILASKIDGVLVVSDITRANKLQLGQVKTLLGVVLGVFGWFVVNKLRPSRNNSSYYYYYSSDEQGSEGGNHKSHRSTKNVENAVPVNATKSGAKVALLEGSSKGEQRESRK